MTSTNQRTRYLKLEEKLKEVVGKARGRLVGEAGKIRHMETNLGNLVVDIMRKAAISGKIKRFLPP